MKCFCLVVFTSVYLFVTSNKVIAGDDPHEVQVGYPTPNVNPKHRYHSSDTLSISSARIALPLLSTDSARRYDRDSSAAIRTTRSNQVIFGESPCLPAGPRVS